MRDKFTKLSTFAICLGLVCLFLTGSGLAGTTSTTVINLDCTPGIPGRVITVPANTVTRAMNVVRNINQDFIIRLTLSSGSEFLTPTLPASIDLSLSVAGGGAMTPTIITGGTGGDTSVDYLVDITTSFTSFPTLELDTTGWTIRDGNNLLAIGGVIQITVQTIDPVLGIVFDSGTDTVDWLNVAGLSCPDPFICIDSAELIEVSIARALKSEETVVAQLLELLSKAEIIAELKGRDADSMVAVLADASIAIDDVNFAVDLYEANSCPDAEFLESLPVTLSLVSDLDDYVSSRLGDPFSEITLQTLLKIMGDAIDLKVRAMQTLIFADFF